MSTSKAIWTETWLDGGMKRLAPSRCAAWIVTEREDVALSGQSVVAATGQIPLAVHSRQLGGTTRHLIRYPRSYGSHTLRRT